MTTTDLHPFVDKDLTSDFCRPFTAVDRTGKVWNCASNFKYLLALKGRGQYKRFQGHGENLGMILRLIHSDPIAPTKVKVADLLEWIGDTTKDDGLILGVILHLMQIKRLLETAPLKTVEMWKPGEPLVEDDRCVAFTQPKWRAVVMGCEGSNKDLPVFDEEDGEELSALDLAELLADD